MKKLLLILSCCWVYFVSAQYTNKPDGPVKKYRSNYSKHNSIKEDPNDSAFIYYRLGWDAYKAKDFGAARYFWEHGANCNTNIPSRYSSAFRLGLMHQEGEGVGINYEIAYYYFNLAYADGKSEGDVDATKNLAAYYEMGRVVPLDYNKALEWYIRAKKQGNRYCNEDIDRIKKKLGQ
jgi:hypothetical protein